MMTRERLAGLVDALKHFYGAIVPPPEDPYALRLWQALAVGGASPHGRDAAFLAFRRIPAVTPDAVWGAAPAKLEAAAAMAGSGRDQRLGAVREITAAFRRHPELSSIPRLPLRQAARLLRSMHGWSRADSDWLLLFCARHPVLPLDPGLCRVAARLGYGGTQPPGRKARGARAARRALRRDVDADVAMLREVCFWFSQHGMATCTEDEPHCTVCPISGSCPTRPADHR